LEKPNSSKWVQKAGWVKIRNLSLGYTIPKHLLDGHEIRIHASAQNLFTITGYKGLDPEAQVNAAYSQDFYGGVEYGTYPQPRIYTVGLTYKF
jgi:outer membrane receptor protein involved in Fe transport